MHFGWVRFNIEISKVTGPNFTVLVSPNAGGITVDGIKIRTNRHMHNGVYGTKQRYEENNLPERRALQPETKIQSNLFHISSVFPFLTKTPNLNVQLWSAVNIT